MERGAGCYRVPCLCAAGACMSRSKPTTDWAERLAVNPRERSSTVATGCAHHTAFGDGVQVLPSKLFNPCPQISLFIKRFLIPVSFFV